MGAGDRPGEVAESSASAAWAQAEENRLRRGRSRPTADATLEMEEDEDWHRYARGVHLNGTFFCSREALRIMSEQGSGCIVNLGSIMGHGRGRRSAALLRREGPASSDSRRSPRPRRRDAEAVRVNAIAPGVDREPT